mmetsp:Transcript_12543/g.29730  ORF Transcript_12543/g.29730 Transcript_12543/m.29730 type:complete len:85 (-) Transcript_12543:146-400(-)
MFTLLHWKSVSHGLQSKVTVKRSSNTTTHDDLPPALPHSIEMPAQAGPVQERDHNDAQCVAHRANVRSKRIACVALLPVWPHQD